MPNSPYPAPRTTISQTPVAANDSPDDVSPTERLSWLVELMSRYAREFADSHDSHESPRLAAAIVAHLRSLVNDLPPEGRMTDAVEHWLEMWDGILSLHLGQLGEQRSNLPLKRLVERARAF
jgi:hypothetical protein